MNYKIPKETRSPVRIGWLHLSDAGFLLLLFMVGYYVSDMDTVVPTRFRFPFLILYVLLLVLVILRPPTNPKARLGQVLYWKWLRRDRLGVVHAEPTPDEPVTRLRRDAGLGSPRLNRTPHHQHTIHTKEEENTNE
ncbi:hypothetical protein EXIGUO8A_440002 [Exiguobacterium sp. 8A]|nr:hypothetical protein EXIGUO8A_440002 [Exiguobacterium sp. 8A]